MAIITFWNDGKVETSQSMTLAAIATSLAVNYNYKILMINTKHNDKSLERAFEPRKTVNSIFAKGKIDLDTGLSGVAKAILSNKTSPEIITNYTKVIWKNLELLTDKNVSENDFERYIRYIKEIIKLANKYYDLVLVDLEGEIENQEIKQILEISNVKVVTLAQNINVIEDFLELQFKNNILKEENTIISIGKYDEKSKYTTKNIAKYMKQKKVYKFPYNTLFATSAPEGKVADYIWQFNRVNGTHVNAKFITAVKEETEEILRMIKEQQRKIY